MIKNFDISVKTMDGKEMLDGGKTPMLMKNIIMEVLLVNEQGLDGPAKVSRYNLAKKVSEGGDANYTVEELSDIKTAVGKYAVPLVVGQILPYCDKDPDEPVSEKKKK